jgi:hypothetical protein
VGRYVITAGEKEGATEPEERIKGTTVTITKDKIIMLTAGDDRRRAPD